MMGVKYGVAMNKMNRSKKNSFYGNDDNDTYGDSTQTDGTWNFMSTPFSRVADTPICSDPESAYRGFATSIAHSFVNQDESQVDVCSMACCGIMQRDRNNFLLTGKKPSSCLTKAFWLVFLPAVVITLGFYFHYLIPSSELNIIIGISTLVAILLAGMVAVVVNMRKRIHMRRQLLWQKYRMTGAIIPRIEELDVNNDSDYLMGQTHRDLACAHTCVGCYRNDVAYGEMEAQTYDCCGFFWKCWLGSCFGKCGTIVQCCGICATAQESREINKKIPEHLQMIDYLTMEPVMNYYTTMLQNRLAKNESFFSQLGAMSSLSKQIIFSFVIGVLLVAGITVLYKVSYLEMGILGGIFLLGVVLTWVLHWPFNGDSVSVDLVVKAFAVGFCVATTMAIVWETLLGLFFLTGFNTTMYFLGDFNEAYNDYQVHSGSEASFLHTLLSADTFGKEYPYFYIGYLFVHCFVIAALIEELFKYFAFKMLSGHPDLWTKFDLEKIVKSTGFGVDKETGMKKRALLPEEQEDSLIDAQERPLTDRCRAIMVVMVAVAVGFSCCENLVITALQIGQIDWRKVVIGAAVPIHPICAALQAIAVCRRDIECERSIGTGRILLPGIFWHGLYDFSILLSAFLYDEMDMGMWWQALAVLPVILFGSMMTLYVGYKRQQARLEGKTESWLNSQNSPRWDFNPKHRFAPPPGYSSKANDDGIEISGGNVAAEPEMPPESSCHDPVEDARRSYTGPIPAASSSYDFASQGNPDNESTSPDIPLLPSAMSDVSDSDASGEIVYTQPDGDAAAIHDDEHVIVASAASYIFGGANANEDGTVDEAGKTVLSAKRQKALNMISRSTCAVSSVSKSTSFLDSVTGPVMSKSASFIESIKAPVISTSKNILEYTGAQTDEMANKLEPGIDRFIKQTQKVGNFLIDPTPSFPDLNQMSPSFPDVSQVRSVVTPIVEEEEEPEIRRVKTMEHPPRNNIQMYVPKKRRSKRPPRDEIEASRASDDDSTVAAPAVLPSAIAPVSRSKIIASTPQKRLPPMIPLEIRARAPDRRSSKSPEKSRRTKKSRRKDKQSINKPLPVISGRAPDAPIPRDDIEAFRSETLPVRPVVDSIPKVAVAPPAPPRDDFSDTISVAAMETIVLPSARSRTIDFPVERVASQESVASTAIDAVDPIEVSRDRDYAVPPPSPDYVIGNLDLKHAFLREELGIDDYDV